MINNPMAGMLLKQLGLSPDVLQKNMADAHGLINSVLALLKSIHETQQTVLQNQSQIIARLDALASQQGKIENGT